ncbi:hypothetical protein [Microvirga pudoricolor]|uniref:hypothetical protein n=1 Tax=Microvirga pudoricolor TaxID=2778729 RepID=UPI0019507150|nr:hypothetical protein [Microvirga pudoricolor]MBM6596501.1 hypothetical protein [Microvirga pudoricolor]
MTTILTVGEDVRVNASTAHRAESPHIARFTDGSTLIAWSSDGRDGSGKGIFFQKLNASGQPVFTDDRLGNVGDTPGDQILQDVTALGDGGWLITYLTGSTLRQIRFNPDGSVKSGAPVNVSSDKPILDARTERLADGGWAVVWWASGNALKQGDLYMQRFAADGTRLYATDRPVNVVTDGNQAEIDLVALPGGGWVVTWVSLNQAGAGSSYDVYLQRYDAFGNPASSSDIRVNRDIDRDQFDPKVTALKDGGYVVTWSSFGTDGSIDVYQQRYASNGTSTWTTDKRVNLSTPGSQTQATVTAMDDGGWIVTWQSSQVGHEGTYQQRYDVNGNALYAADLRIGPAGTTPCIESTGDGGWMAVLESGSNIVQRHYTPGTALTAGKDIATGRDGADWLQVEDGGLSLGDSIQGGGGFDTLVSMGGTLDLTQPAILTGIEAITGSEGADIVIANVERLTGIVGFDGKGGVDELRLEVGTYDLRGKTFVAWEAISLGGDGILTFDSKLWALLSHAVVGSTASIVLTADAFTKAERALLKSRGFTTIIDSNGTELPNEAPSLDAPASVTKVSDTDGALPFAHVSLADADGDILTVTITPDSPAKGSLKAPAGVTGSFDTLTGTLTLTGTPEALTAALRAVTFDPMDRPTSVAGSVEATSFTISVTDGNSDSITTTGIMVEATAANRAPADIGLTGASIEELSVTGTVIGTLSTQDTNAGEIFSYTLTNNAGGRFSLAGNKLVVANGYALDFEQAASHRVTIKSTDRMGASIEKSFIVQITDRAVEIVTAPDSGVKLVGGRNRDVLIGGRGSDTLAGGLGNDTLKGHAGKDIFVFDTKPNRKTNADKILDINVRDDTIHLDNAIFKKLGKAGKLKAAYFTIGEQAKDKNDYLIYNKTKGTLSYDADGSGKVAAILIATLPKKLKMTAADFFVI